MELIKRKINIDDYISRKEGTWGQVTATTFNINVFFTQDGDDMGIGTEMPFIEEGIMTVNNNFGIPKLVDYSILTNFLLPNNWKFEFMKGTTTSIVQSSAYPNTRYPGKGFSGYFTPQLPVTGLTEDRLDTISSYDNQNRFKVGFDISKSNDIDYQRVPYVNGTRVISNSNLNPITYLIDGDTDSSAISALPNTKRGVYYITKTGDTRTITGTNFGVYRIPYTEMHFNSEGFNETNSHLSATTKEEYLFGITSEPTVFNDLFIDRGRATVLQSHMQLGEIKNMSDLINYGNGFYNL